MTGLPSDGHRRRPAGMGGLIDGVRQQVYQAADGRFVYLMALEEKFWQAFCVAIDRPDLYERWPGAAGADDAAGQSDLADALSEVFAGRSAQEWATLAKAHQLSLAPVTPRTEFGEDAQLRERMGWLPAASLGADQLPIPIRLVGRAQPTIHAADLQPRGPADVSWLPR